MHLLDRCITKVSIIVVYVCWKSRGSPAARGRISIELSMDEFPIEIPDDLPEKVQPTRRGWWDYVSEVDTRQVSDVQTTASAKKPRRRFKNVLSTIADFRERKKEAVKKKKSRFYKKNSEKKPSNTLQDGIINLSRNSFAPSSMSRFSRLMPRMELFQEVMKDEVGYIMSGNTFVD